MRKSFALRTEPHVAEIGDDIQLLFQAEVMGDAFLDSLTKLREVEREHGAALTDPEQADPARVRRVMRAQRVFLARQMLPESAAEFLRLNVVDEAGAVLHACGDLDEAEAVAAEHPGARVVDELGLPPRVMAELIEWIVELMGGGDRPTTSSSGSATASRPSGTRGTAASPSRASTRTRGR